MDIKTITFPGFVQGLSNTEYRSAEGWSKSDLDKINKSPAHYFADRKEDSAALAFGQALHTAVLEPDTFESRYIVAPKIDRRTKEGKAAYAQFELSAMGKTIIDEDDKTKALAMRDAINKHPVAKNIFKDGIAESSFFWIDPTTGLKCKCRTDFIRFDGIVVDLKSCQSCDPHDFAKSMAYYRYHVQAAYYTDGIFSVGDFSVFDAPTDFLLVAIEKDPPFGLRVYRVDDRSLDIGRRAYKRDHMTVADFVFNPERLGWYNEVVYPDSTEIAELSLPAWAE